MDVRGLRKGFGRSTALDGLDLEVAGGTVHGFLGPNGAGKSTTIRVALGLLKADTGEIRVLGADPWTRSTELHRRIAYVPGDVTLWPALTGGEVIDLLARLGNRRQRVARDELLGRFDLDPTKPCRQYSKGNRQKVALVSALGTDADLYVLDEPTSGLDPLMEAQFQQCVRELAAEGRTVLLSSHVLAEVEEMCRSVTIINRGRTVKQGLLSELRHLTTTTVDVETRAPVDLGSVEVLGSVDRVGANRIRFDVATADLQPLMERLVVAGIVALSTRPPTLEDIFLRLYDEPPS